jgi:hypothetical protein
MKARNRSIVKQNISVIEHGYKPLPKIPFTQFPLAYSAITEPADASESLLYMPPPLE